MKRRDRQAAFELCLCGLASHPDELLARLTARQWQEWLIYFELAGPPDFRADHRAAIIAHAAAQPHVRKKLSVADFFPGAGKATPEETDAEMLEKCRAWCAGVAARKKMKG